MAEEIEILLMNPVSETLSDGLAGGYRVARLWEAEDPERLLATRGPAIRGLVTGGHVGAGRALIDRLPALEIIAVHGVGYDKVDLEAARARAIAISHTPDVLTDDVADLAVGLAIAQTRRICEGDRHVRDGLWASARLPLARKFSERRCGILGLGRIGTAIARRLEGFGVEIGYYDVRAQAVDYRLYGSLVELAAHCDVLIVAAAASARTTRMVGREVLDALGPDGLLVNVARGLLVNVARGSIVDGRSGRGAGRRPPGRRGARRLRRRAQGARGALRHDQRRADAPCGERHRRDPARHGRAGPGQPGSALRRPAAADRSASVGRRRPG